MTHSVVIYALMVSRYPRRRPIYPTSYIITPGGLMRYLLKTMKPLSWWRSPKDVLGPTVGDLMTLQPLLGSCGSCVWSPWYAVDDVHEGCGAPIFDCDGWLWSCMEVWWRSFWRDPKTHKMVLNPTCLIVVETLGHMTHTHGLKFDSKIVV